MNGVVDLIVGPLAGPECRRAAQRRWPFVVRALAATAAMGVAVAVLWYWWISQEVGFAVSPYLPLRANMAVLVQMAGLVALLLAPALLAGSLAGEKERGALGLLLTTRVSAWEVVVGRLASRLAQVGMIELAGLPAIALIGSLTGFGPGPLAMMLILPMALALGAGGLSLASSALSRRGRDALLAVYLLEGLLGFAPRIATLLAAPTLGGWLEGLDPFSGMYRLAFDEEVGPALIVTATWVALGLLGAAVASWRLRPACMAATGGSARVDSGGRRGFVPPVDEVRPMLWKELYVEHTATLGRFGRWAGLLLVLWLAGTSTVLGGVVAWNSWVRPDGPMADWAVSQMSTWIGGPAGWFAALIQWAIGLRAAVGIASERERGTWDALLASPLGGRAIVWGKLWGSLFALRWLIVAAFYAWGLALAVGAMSPSDFLEELAGVLIVGACMAAVGVRTSLAARTTTRAMAATIGIWLGLTIGFAITALILVLIGMLALLLVWLAAVGLGLAQIGAGMWAPMSFELAYTLANLGLFASAGVSIAADASLRFDRLAGRMPDGATAVAVDRIVHGEPVAAVPAGGPVA